VDYLCRRIKQNKRNILDKTDLADHFVGCSYSKVPFLFLSVSVSVNWHCNNLFLGFFKIVMSTAQVKYSSFKLVSLIVLC
jgi:hypothetical protein